MPRMTDLTLNEYRGIPEDVLGPLIKEEGAKMSGIDFIEKTVQKKCPAPFGVLVSFWNVLDRRILSLMRP
jgi:hypothetical protein